MRIARHSSNCAPESGFAEEDSVDPTAKIRLLSPKLVTRIEACAVRWSCDGQWLASSHTDDHAIRVWRGQETSRRVANLSAKNDPGAHGDHHGNSLNGLPAAPAIVLNGHEHSARELEFSPVDSALLVSSCVGGEVSRPLLNHADCRIPNIRMYQACKEVARPDATGGYDNFQTMPMELQLCQH